MGSYFCSGAIIGAKWILTSGYCVFACFIDSIVYGTNQLYDYHDGYPNTSIKIKTCYQHPKFPEAPIKTLIYDIGIIELEEPIPFSDIAQPVKLPEANYSTPFHVQGILTGWGSNETGGHMSKYLQKVNLQLLTDDECSTIMNGHEKDSFNSTHHLCSDNNYNGACRGDMADPYVINGTVYGLSSWTFSGPCGSYPTVYSRIDNPEYRNWIKNVTNI